MAVGIYSDITARDHLPPSMGTNEYLQIFTMGAGHHRPVDYRFGPGVPVRSLPPDKRLDELFPLGRELEDYSLPQKASLFSLETFFLVMDKFLNAYVKFQ